MKSQKLALRRMIPKEQHIKDIVRHFNLIADEFPELVRK